MPIRIPPPKMIIIGSENRAATPAVDLIIVADNEAVIKILAKGRSAKLRHVHRTHRVNLDWLYEVFRRPEVLARYVQTDYQIADIGIKAINERRYMASLGLFDGDQASRQS